MVLLGPRPAAKASDEALLFWTAHKKKAPLWDGAQWFEQFGIELVLCTTLVSAVWRQKSKLATRRFKTGHSGSKEANAKKWFRPGTVSNWRK
jgi:hypothetical protein